MSKGVLFCDFDGVLTRPDFQFEHGGGKLDPVLVCALDLIVYRLDLQVVVTSTWRGNLDFLRKLLWDSGLARRRCLDLDQTPHLESRKRGEEIVAWLKEHPKVTSFAIVDDDSFDMGAVLPWLVRTDPRVGLTVKHEGAIYERLQMTWPPAAVGKEGA